MIRTTILGAALALAAGQASAATTTSSAASIASGSIVVGGSTVTIPAQLPVSGTAPPAYSVHKSVPSFKSTVTLPDETTLSIATGAVIDEAASKGLVGTTATATAISSVRGLTAAVTNPIVSGMISIAASDIIASAKFTTTTGGTPTGGGTVTISNLSINLSLLGLPTVTYTGKPKANTVLYKSPTGDVVITLNKETFTKTGTTKTGVTVNAVDLHLNNASILGISVSGTIDAGTASAT